MLYVILLFVFNMEKIMSLNLSIVGSQMQWCMDCEQDIVGLAANPPTAVQGQIRCGLLSGTKTVELWDAATLATKREEAADQEQTLYKWGKTTAVTMTIYIVAMAALCAMVIFGGVIAGVGTTFLLLQLGLIPALIQGCNKIKFDWLMDEFGQQAVLQAQNEYVGGPQEPTPVALDPTHPKRYHYKVNQNEAKGSRCAIESELQEAMSDEERAKIIALKYQRSAVAPELLSYYGRVGNELCEIGLNPSHAGIPSDWEKWYDQIPANQA